MKYSEIKEVAGSQQDALEKRDFGILRDILPELPNIKSHALIVSGIRRCGKSTILHQFAKRLKNPFFYFNFDDLRLVNFSQGDFALLDRAIKESNSRLLFFDEIQSAENWELYIRQKLDEGYQLVTTGSNAALLRGELGSKLTGRHISKELFPFSYNEFCRFTRRKADASSLGIYLEKGGFPEYLKTDNREILVQLQQDILYRDIASRYGLRDVSSLRQLYAYLVSNPGQLISPSKLLGAAGVKSATTVLEYFSYFEMAYLTYMVPHFAWSAKARSLAPKKMYSADPGIIKTGSISFSPNHGALLENFVFLNLRSKSRDIYYFTDKNNNECDFIVNPGRKAPPDQGAFHGAAPTQCIQVCWELNTDNQDREIRGLLSAMEFFGLDEGLIITFDQRDLILEKGKRIEVVPGWYKSI